MRLCRDYASCLYSLDDHFSSSEGRCPTSHCPPWNCEQFPLYFNPCLANLAWLSRPLASAFNEEFNIFRPANFPFSPPCLLRMLFGRDVSFFGSCMRGYNRITFLADINWQGLVSFLTNNLQLNSADSFHFSLALFCFLVTILLFTSFTFISVEISAKEFHFFQFSHVFQSFSYKVRILR